MRRPWSSQSRHVSLLLIALAGCGGLRASRIQLGGERDVAQPVAPPSSASAAAVASAPTPVPATDEAEGDAEEAEVVAVAAAPAPSVSAAAAAPTAPGGAFQLKPYAAGQSWTRVFDLEVAVKVGPGGGLDMRMTSHQEARFEVIAARSGTIEKLAIDYQVYKSSLSVMGSTQDSPEEIAGKRYVITFAGGKPDVRAASGATPSKKELDSVKDDAREPAEAATALAELSALAAKGRGDFSIAGAIALAGGQDEDTKVTQAKASLQKLGNAGPRGERSASIELAYTLTNAADDGTTIEANLTGSLLALDAPARYHTVTLSGPLELRATDADGMAGRGTTKLSVTYKY